MLSAYMSEVKSEGNGFYFPYAASMTPNVVTHSFPSYGVPLGTYEPKEESYPASALSQNQPPQPPSTKTPAKTDSETSKKYRERRDKNNLAAKKSRCNRREREKLMQRKVEELERENEALRAQLALYTQQLEYAKKEYERQMSISYATQPQGVILRENTNSMMAQPQPSFFYSTQFAHQPTVT